MSTTLPSGIQDPKPTYTRAFFSTGTGPEVSLLVDPKNPTFEPGRPALFGTIAGQSVSIFVNPPGSRDSLSIQARGARVGTAYEPDTPFATGNLVVTKDALVRLAVTVIGRDQTIWAVPRKELTDAQRAAAGLDGERLELARAAKEQRQATERRASSAY